MEGDGAGTSNERPEIDDGWEDRVVEKLLAKLAGTKAKGPAGGGERIAGGGWYQYKLAKLGV